MGETYAFANDVASAPESQWIHCALALFELLHGGVTQRFDLWEARLDDADGLFTRSLSLGVLRVRKLVCDIRVGDKDNNIGVRDGDHLEVKRPTVEQHRVTLLA
jgi:hypothetical protein